MKKARASSQSKQIPIKVLPNDANASKTTHVPFTSSNNATRLLQDLTVTLPVIQLLQHFCEIRREWASLLGFTAESGDAQRAETDRMDVDVNHLRLDTSMRAKEMGPVSLQSVAVLV